MDAVGGPHVDTQALAQLACGILRPLPVVMLQPMAPSRCPPPLPAPTPYLARRCPDCGLQDAVPRAATDPADAVAVVLACSGCDPEPHTIIRWLDLRGEDCA